MHDDVVLLQLAERFTIFFFKNFYILSKIEEQLPLIDERIKQSILVVVVLVAMVQMAFFCHLMSSGSSLVSMLK